uniref:F-box/kelch-repeat protein At3g06240 family n=2 Tax=Cajanus cajan TaxID=3821 RepID=A0A151STL4_CAJCA|nr:F-box/kelch-repeat protein At3g06240 family [Cajanus cajan]
MLLPWELIIEILLRLPVKSLIHFKTVCKSWLTLISDPHFASSHFELAAACTERLVFVSLALSLPSVPEFRTIDFNAHLLDDSASPTFKNMFYRPRPYDDIEFLGSCRGFLLLELNGIFCVWNPSTGAYKFVHPSPVVTGRRKFFAFRGFGYDPSTDDYLVVQVYHNKLSGDYATLVDYFSIKTNSWKEIGATPLNYRQCFSYRNSTAGCFLNGAIHWLAVCYDASIHVIAAFDLTERSLSHIPLPLNFEHHDFNPSFLRILGGSLNLCSLGRDSLEIWMMKEYKVKSSWTKTVVMPIDALPTGLFFPICYTKSGDIVGTNAGARLTKCDVNGVLLEHRFYRTGSSGSKVAVYKESLLSLPCDTKQAGEDD